MIIEVNSKNFDKETGHGLKLVEFYAIWCTYCMKQRIELKEFENSEMKIHIVDGDECPDLVKRFKIQGYPTFVLLKDGKETAQFSGFHTKSLLLNKLMNYLSHE